MAGTRLDPGLVRRIAEKTGIKDASVRQQASRRAGRLGVRSEAALILWAQELGIGTTRHFNKLPPELQAPGTGCSTGPAGGRLARSAAS